MDRLEKVPADAGQGKDAPGASVAAAAAGKGKDDTQSLRDEIARLTKTNQQLSDSERYWAGKAQTPAVNSDDEPKPKAGKAEAEDDLDDPAAFVEALSTKGPKAIAAYLKKAGYITKAEAEDIASKSSKAAVAIARKSLTQDAELVGGYPELKDEKSELFKRTGDIYREMVADDPRMKDSPAALKSAARSAKAELALEAKKVVAKDDEDDPETKRQERVAAQSGSKGRRSSAAFDEDDEDAMGPQTKELLKAFSRYGVTEETFKAEKKKLKGAA